MGDLRRRVATFARQLGRRHVYHVAAVYGGVAYSVVEIAHATLPTLGFPARVNTAIVLAAIAGFPLALVGAWIFGGSPEEEEAPEGDGEARAGSRPARPARPDDGRTRLIALPFRPLRPDPDTDFLAFSLPDAVTCSLQGIRSLVVRTNLSAGRFGDAPDLAAVARECEVDAVLTGTLLRAGEQLRVSVQLARAPEGTMLWSQAFQLPLDDLFALQDQVSQAVVRALALPLTSREKGLLGHDVPASPKAYELYLRANQLALQADQWAAARDLYLRALELDPSYAPAWARLARCYRLIGKFVARPDEASAAVRQAEDAFERALELNPDLPIAHCLYAQLDVDRGRGRDAMLRLIARAHATGSDPEIFTALVHSCRYVGLLDASLAAHERARELDPQARTSVAHTHFMLGDFGRAMEEDLAGQIGYLRGHALASLGREDEAISFLREREQVYGPETRVHALVRSLRAALEGERAEALEAAARAAEHLTDGEARFYLGRQLARLGAHAEALAQLGRGVELGYHCLPAYRNDPWLEPLRAEPRFAEIVKRAGEGHGLAASAFRQAGGEQALAGGEAMVAARTG